MVASILSKKIVAGSEYVLIDLPTGKGAKSLVEKKLKTLEDYLPLLELH